MFGRAYQLSYVGSSFALRRRRGHNDIGYDFIVQLPAYFPGLGLFKPAPAGSASMRSYKAPSF